MALKRRTYTPLCVQQIHCFFVLTHAQVGGRGGFDLNFHVFSVEACGVSLGGGATSADLGDSSNDSNESFED